jgi:hypothetical protein
MMNEKRFRVILILFYLSGCPASYFSLREACKLEHGFYSVENRNKNLFLLPFSWVGFIVGQAAIWDVKHRNDHLIKATW